MELWSAVLIAALEAGFGVLAAAGFEDQIRDIKTRLTKGGEKKRQDAFRSAFDKAVQVAGEDNVRPLLEHGPFRDLVIAGLMDPVQGLDLPSLADKWSGDLPKYAPALRRFFTALEGALRNDSEIWGPLLARWEELRFREDVREALQRRPGLDVSPHQMVSSVSAQLTGDGPAAAAAIQVSGNVLGNIILNVVQHYLVTEGRREKPIHPAVQEPSVVQVAYLKRITRECGLVRLLGLDTAAGDAKAKREDDLQLEAVYVHLDTTHSDIDETAGKKGGRASVVIADERARTLTALEAAARFHRLVLTGGPGAGKSTFADYLALCLAVHGLPANDRPFPLQLDKHLPGWPENQWFLPVRVTLREFARALPTGTRQGNAELLWQYIESRLNPLCEFAATLKNELIGGRALVVLDGLDEVTEKRGKAGISPRRLVLESVQDFALNVFPQAHYLVTCRVASYVAPWTLKEFDEVRLAEFSQPKRDLFCQLWYVELARRDQLAQDSVPGNVYSLQRAIRRPDLERIAGNPLLLSVMALVHVRLSELPDARARLYKECIEVLLWLWEQRKKEHDRPSDLLSLLQEADVDRVYFVRTLDKLAYDVHERGGAQPGETDILTSVLERRGRALHPQSDVSWAERVVAFIRERAGLLVEKRADEDDPVLAFPHRTFQEYLAARWLTEGTDMGCQAYKLAKEGDHWWEVIKLAAGHLLYVDGRPGQSLSIPEWLCPDRRPHDSAA